MSTSRPSSRRLSKASAGRDAKRPSSARLAKQGGKSARNAPTRRPSESADADAAKRAATRRTPVERTPSKAPWIIGAVVVVVIAVVIAYAPVRRALLLSELDGATGAVANEAADRWFAFEQRRESALRTLIARNHGPFSAQLHLVRSAESVAAATALAERGDLDDAQLAETLTTATEVFATERHRNERRPRELATWAESHDDRTVANAALGLQVRFAAAGTDKEATSALLARIAGDPAQDPLRSQAALDGLATLVDSDTLGHALGLLRGGAADLVLAHAGIGAAIRSNARAGHLVELLGLLDHPNEGVRALSLDCMARLTLPDNTDPAQRRDLGIRVGSKLVATTPKRELAAALQAVKSLRLAGASEAVLGLAAQRDALGLPGIDDAFWIQCLGDAFIFTTPEAARQLSEQLISRLAELVNDDAMRPIAAGALGRIRDPNFINLRAGLDALAAHLDEPACREALTTLVDKTYGRDDVLKVCGDDPAAWQSFLAKDRPRFIRIADIRAYVDANRGSQRISDGKQKLGEVKDFLDKARDELQVWLDDKSFVAPLGLTQSQIESLFRDVQELNVSVRKAFSGAL